MNCCCCWCWWWWWCAVPARKGGWGPRSRRASLSLKPTHRLSRDIVTRGIISVFNLTCTQGTGSVQYNAFLTNNSVLGWRNSQRCTVFSVEIQPADCYYCSISMYIYINQKCLSEICKVCQYWPWLSSRSSRVCPGPGWGSSSAPSPPPAAQSGTSALQRRN